MKNKAFLTVTTLVVLLLLVTNSFFAISNILAAPVPPPSLKVDLSLSEPPVLGKTLQIKFTVVVDKNRYEDCPNTTAQINLPDGFKFVSGELGWIGTVQKYGPPVIVSADVTPIKEGEWKIEGSAMFSPRLGSTYGDVDELYTAVFKNKGFVSHTPVFHSKGPAWGRPGASFSSPADVVSLTRLDLKIDPLGQEAELTYIVSALQDAPETKVEMRISSGIKVEEPMNWTGDIAKGSQIVLKSKVKAVKSGRWEILAYAVSNYTYYSGDILRIYILDEPKLNFFPLNILPFLKNHLFVYSLRETHSGSTNINVGIDLSPTNLELPLNQTAELTYTATSLNVDIPDAVVNIDLPPSLELVSGNIEWRGSLNTGIPVQQKLIIKAIQVGNWQIKGIAGYYIDGEYFEAINLFGESKYYATVQVK